MKTLVLFSMSQSFFHQGTILTGKSKSKRFKVEVCRIVAILFSSRNNSNFCSVNGDHSRILPTSQSFFHQGTILTRHAEG